MSVVNTMLRELAARQTDSTVIPFAGANGTSTATVTATPAPARRGGLMIFALLLVLAVLIVWWRWSAQTATVAVSTEVASQTLDNSEGQAKATALAVVEAPMPIANPDANLNANSGTALAASPSAASATPSDANQLAAPASIGWELVEITVPDEVGIADDRTWPDAEPIAAAPITASEPAAIFERQPSTQSAAEQLAHWRSNAQRALTSGDWASADRALIAGLQIAPGDAELLSLQLQRQAMSDPVAAEHRAEQLLQQWPQHWQIRQWLASQWLQQSRIANALHLLSAQAPPLAEAADYHATLALAEQQHGDHRAASERYRQLLTVQPQNGRHQAGLALSLEAMSDVAGAQRAWRSALLDPALPATLMQFAHQRLRALGATPAAQVSP